MNTPTTPFVRRAFATAACFCVLLSAALPSHALMLADGGKSRFAIVVGDDAIPAEMAAAKELRSTLRQVTGATLPVLRESQAAGHARQILVGTSAAVRKLLPGQDWQALGMDGIVIKSLPDKLILAGGRPRGALYAVYTFLEDTVGVRWWTSSETFVPKHRTLEIPELNVVYSPKLLYREHLNYDCSHNPGFAAHMKMNGHFCNIPRQQGGHYNILGFCHTIYNLLPPATYFAAHPDWYSLRDGKRIADMGQLCWSNPGMRQELTSSALALIRENPSAGIISISQNDWFGFCQCEACAAIAKQEGSEAGPLIDGVNAVAAEIAKQYPDFLVETLAYQYSRKAPRTIRPARNVLIRLCSIEANFAQPLSSDANADFRNDLLAWKAIAPNLFVWNYVTNFHNYLLPHPNMLPLAEDLRFFTQNNVVGVFEQGDCLNNLAGDFLPLRNWLIAHLMWDPALDQAKLRDEFLRGYYGAAAPYMAQYLDLVNAPAKSPAFHVGCLYDNTSFLTSASLEQATDLFAKASKAVAGDRDLSRRVRRERLAIDHVKIMRYDLAHVAAASPGKAEEASAAYNALVADFVDTALKLGVHSFSETRTFERYIAGLMGRCLQRMPPKLPPAGSPMPKGSFDLQEDKLRLSKPGELTQIVDDPKASNGKAVRMPGNHTEWAVQYRVATDAKCAGRGPWRCYIVARCDAKTSAGAAFRFGLQGPGAQTIVADEAAPLEIAGDGQYHVYAIVVGEIRPDQYFWAAPIGNAAAVDAVYIDRIFLQRARRPL